MGRPEEHPDYPGTCANCYRSLDDSDIKAERARCARIAREHDSGEHRSEASAFYGDHVCLENSDCGEAIAAEIEKETT